MHFPKVLVAFSVHSATQPSSVSKSYEYTHFTDCSTSLRGKVYAGILVANTPIPQMHVCIRSSLISSSEVRALYYAITCKYFSGRRSMIADNSAGYPCSKQSQKKQRAVSSSYSLLCETSANSLAYSGTSFVKIDSLAASDIVRRKTPLISSM